MPTAIKIKTFKISKRGDRQVQITLPRTWIQEHGLKTGDSIDMLKDTENRLIIKPARKILSSDKEQK